eukprot:evm.model.scf_392.4 EVM.evm.TU.scf_392.4   scf_392:17480-19531(+)
MSASAPQAAPPLDRESFERVVRLRALRVPTKRCHQLLKALRGVTLSLPRVRSVVPDGDSPDTRLLLLSEALSRADPTSLPEALSDAIRREGLSLVHHDLTLSYSHLSAEQVLRELLPDGMEVPSSFETVGHIAHMNLREEQRPYGALIGTVILDKNPAVKSVVSKVGTIENEYRVFGMELLAGIQDMETVVRQHGCHFRLDYSKVYWNSRLEHEHQRLVDLFSPDDAICDMMAGIGPFAIPAAKKGCTVYANDLNPVSFHYLKENIVQNRVQKKVHAFNLDGREFVKALCGYSGTASKEFGEDYKQLVFDHVIMNLPSTAVEFLDAFRFAFSPQHWRGHLPTVHCYTFQKSNESQQDVIRKCELHLGCKISPVPQIHEVRDVAPNKHMLCVSFRVPEDIACLPNGGEIGPSCSPLDAVGSVQHETDTMGGVAAAGPFEGETCEGQPRMLDGLGAGVASEEIAQAWKRQKRSGF